jgi:hypothetical protein
MGKLKTIAYPAENNQFINVPKRMIDLLNKKTIITNLYALGDEKGKLVIEYRAKHGSNRGVMELYDMYINIPREENFEIKGEN